MNTCYRRMATVGGIWICLALCAPDCHAGPILDWLFPGRAARRQASQTITYRIPVNAYGNAQYGYAAQPYTANYAPTTSYRTVWAQVPVTTYRPVTYVNPLSAGQASAVHPCTTYSWQARRVPYTSYQPIVAPAATSCAVGAAPIASSWSTVGCGTSCAIPTTTSYAYSSTPATLSSSTSVGYPTGQSFSPTTAMPQSYASPSCSCNGGTTDSYSSPQTVPAWPSSSSPALPADTPPSLLDQPAGGQGATSNGDSSIQGTSLRINRSNEPTMVYPANGEGRMRPIPQTSGDDWVLGGGQIDRSSDRNRVRAENNNQLGDGPLYYPADSQGEAKSRTQPLPRLQPIPDPERRQKKSWDTDWPTRPFDDTQQTADYHRKPQWEAVPINWVRVDLDRRGAIRRIPSGLTVEKPVLDESGWRPVSGR